MKGEMVSDEKSALPEHERYEEDQGVRNLVTLTPAKGIEFT